MTRVLVVDDEEDIRLLTRLILEGAGYEVDEAASGPEAIDHLAAASVDLMILDIRMPGMDGWELMDALEECTELKAPPILAFSAHVHPDVLDGTRARGCSGFLVKPFTRQECLDAVAAALA